MTKVLFLLSAVVMVVAGIFSYQNRDAFVKTRLELQDNARKIETEFTKLDGVGGEIADLKSKVSVVQQDLQKDQERLNQGEIKKRNLQADVDRYTKEADDNQKILADYKLKIKDIPPGVTMETINEDINKLKTAIADNEAKAVTIKEQLAGKETELKRWQDQLSDMVTRIEDRKKAFDRNSFTGTITAVNNDWGFVVVGAGKDRGLSPDTVLVVSRGSDVIGKIKVVSVEGSRALCNVAKDTMMSGRSISPGDRVVLESLHQ